LFQAVRTAKNKNRNRKLI